MSPRTGRPKAENPKGINLTIRLDPQMATKLNDYCRLHNISKGEAVRRGIYLLFARNE